MRTGTTILFELLAQDPDARAPLTWEVDAPCPPPEAATYDTDPRIEDSRQIQEMMTSIIPDLKAMHPIGPLLAQECVRITAMDLRSFIFPTIYHVPAYAQWLLGTDMTSAYAWHRNFLQHLQSRIPGEPVGAQVARAHLGAGRDDEAVPGRTGDTDAPRSAADHRVGVLAGVHIAHVRQRGDAASGRSPAEWAEYVIDGIDRSVDARESGIVPASQVVDVQYQSFAADPITTIAAAYDQLGLAFTAEAETKMRSFLAAQPAHEHGGHHYTFAQTGLDEKALRERTARYQDYFDVPNEPLG